MTNSDIAFYGILAAFVAYSAARATGWEFSLSHFFSSKLARALHALVGAKYSVRKVRGKRSTAWDFAN
ncbi:hypothetical protein J4E08_04950 [Sagittula sp. NFXS13]|uniref:Uncharacterized protein n=1 Tax=Sagittula marina TaxID=943940 RepID=A0A7W6GQN9_9RHOB|nr:hypothetical protein [Sagittula marina]MBB3983807.1 hypothetical protein [Sagittula marina]